MREASHVAVIGSGAWGSALAKMLCSLALEVTLYGRDSKTINTINQLHENPYFLPGVDLPHELFATVDLEQALAQSEKIFIAVPAQSTRAVVTAIKGIVAADSTIILCAKGIEQRTGQRMSQIARDYLPDATIAVLSGPSFAADLGRKLPTAVTIAAHDLAVAERLATELSGPFFRCYFSDDVIGVELGGALKNVFAIGAGVVNGRGLGTSAQAALVTRGFAELRRFGARFGARDQTLMGLSVFGDLMLTCSSLQSRNYRYGIALGSGQDLHNLKLAEGVATAPIAAKMCQDHTIDAPIISRINKLLNGEISVDEAWENLFSRPLKKED